MGQSNSSESPSTPAGEDAAPPSDGAAQARPEAGGASETGVRSSSAQAAGDGTPVARAQAEAAEYKDLYVRARADVENVRKRAQEDIAKAHKFGIEGFAESLLPVKDSLEAALGVQAATLESYRDGIEITLRQLGQAFSRNHLVEIAPAAGEKFDPNRHQAISMVPSAVAAQHVVAVLQKGYLIADRVLRPALVTVSQGGGAPGGTGAEPRDGPA